MNVFICKPNVGQLIPQVNELSSGTVSHKLLKHEGTATAYLNNKNQNKM